MVSDESIEQLKEHIPVKQGLRHSNSIVIQTIANVSKSIFQ